MTIEPEHEACPSIADLERYLHGEGGDNVRTHLDECEACQRRIDEIRDNNELLSAIGSVHATSSMGMPQTDPDAALPTIPGYTIVGELHRGGQGIVYEAVQESLGRRVAIKMLLHGNFATSVDRERFRREVDAVARLRHPNVVTIHECGATPDGRPYFSMELIDGSALRPSRDEPADIRTVVTQVVQVCAGVAAAHRRGVIHRDLKPSNIIVDQAGVPHVLDFGLARDVDTNERATRTGYFVGTVAYAAPEQVSGDFADIDTRTDVYAIGMILYELLTGSLPYDTGGPPSQVIRNICEAPPPSLGSQRRGIDRDLDTIILKSLAKEKDRRYESAGALQDDLENYLAGRPINARRDSTSYLVAKLARRHRIPLAFAGAGLVLLVVFAAIISVLYTRVVQENRKSNTIRIFLEDTLASVRPIGSADDVRVKDVLDEAVLWIELALRDQPEVAASMRTTIGNSYRVLTRYDDAQAQLELALRAREDLFGRDDLRTCETMSVIALTARDNGDLEHAEATIREVIDVRRRELGAQHRAVAGSLMLLASIETRTGNHRDAVDRYREALAIRQAALGEVHPDVAMCQYLLAEVYNTMGDRQSALEAHEAALRSRDTKLEDAHPDFARSLVAVGDARLAIGQVDDALDALTRAVSVLTDVWGADDHRTNEARAVLADALAAAGEHEQATREAQAALDVLAPLGSKGADRARNVLDHLRID